MRRTRCANGDTAPLRNGCRGKFVGFESTKSDEDQRLLVDFPTVGTVSTQRQTWYVPLRKSTLFYAYFFNILHPI